MLKFQPVPDERNARKRKNAGKNNDDDDDEALPDDEKEVGKQAETVGVHQLSLRLKKLDGW